MVNLKIIEKAIKEKIPISIAQENLKLELEKLREKRELDKEYNNTLNDLNIEIC